MDVKAECEEAQLLFSALQLCHCSPLMAFLYEHALTFMGGGGGSTSADHHKELQEPGASGNEAGTESGRKRSVKLSSFFIHVFV